MSGHGLEQRLLGLLHGLGLLVLAPVVDLLLEPHDTQPRRDDLVEFLALFVVRLSGAWPNTSPNQAIMRASIGSFLASCPADLAKWRTRLGSAITTSTPAPRSNVAQPFS